MAKRVCALIVCGLFAIGCSGGHPRGKGSTMSFTVATQNQLDEGNQRINEFKQELLNQGFRVLSSSGSDSKEQVILKGDYGKLKDLEVTLWTGKRLDIKEPHLGGGIRTSIASEEAEREFDALYRKVVSIVVGRPEEN